MTECIFPHAKRGNCDGDRWSYFYNLPITDILDANNLPIQTVFSQYKERKGMWVSFKNLSLLLDNCQVKLHEKTYQKLFAFSKMSVINELD